MTSPDPRDRSAAAAPAAHVRHDTFLVAAHAAGDLSGASKSAAESQIATCAACSALYDDLRAIAGATQSLSKVAIPATVSGRDFRLTPEQAARLNRGRGWRRLIQPLASDWSWTRPLAAALTTLGLAGILLTTVLPGLGGLAGSSAAASAAPAAPEQVTVQSAPTAAPAPAAGGVPDTDAGAAGATSGPSTVVDQFGPAAVPSPEGAIGSAFGRNSTTEAPGPPKAAASTTAPAFAAGGAPAASAGGPTSNSQDGMKYEPLQESSPPDSLLSIASVVLIVLGLALFGLRFVARRLS
jgi:hypothetical protein